MNLPNEQFNGGYFVASQEGKYFTQVPAESIDDLLSQSFLVYYVDESYALPQLAESHVDGSQVPNSILVEQSNQHLSASTSVCCHSSVESFQIPHLKSADFTSNLTPETNIPIRTDFGLPTDIDADFQNTNPSPTTKPDKQKSSKTCLLCNLVLNTVKSYRSHMSIHENDRPYKCPQCSETFNYPVNLTIHATLEDPGQPPFYCPLCNSAYSRLSAFKSHILIHQSSDTLSCGVCHNSFKSPSLLKLHTQLEHGQSNSETVPKYQCRLCHTTVSSVGDLLKHYRSYHPGEIKWKKSRQLPERSSECPPKLTTVPCTSTVLPARSSKIEARQMLTKILSSTRGGPNGNLLEKWIEPVPSPMELMDCSTSYVSPRKKSAGRRWRSRHYTCRTCGKKFRTPALVKRHMVRHSNDKPFRCTICQTRFTQKSSAKTHISTHTSGKSNHLSSFCGESFQNEESLIPHLRDQHQDSSYNLLTAELEQRSSRTNVYTPPVAFETFYGPETGDFVLASQGSEVLHPENGSTSHITSVASSNRPFKCCVCNKSFLLPYTLSVHMLRHSDYSSPFVCSVCSCRFSSASRKVRHMRVHSSTNSTQDTGHRTASKRFHGPLKWNRQKRCFVSVQRKLSNKPYKCPDCLHSYERMSHLRYHIRQMHQHNQAPFACSKCLRRFVSAQSLEKHDRLVHATDSPPRQFTCHTCSKSLVSYSSLKRHMVIHSDDRPYKCHICQMQFKFYSSCSKHITRHGRSTEEQSVDPTLAHVNNESTAPRGRSVVTFSSTLSPLPPVSISAGANNLLCSTDDPIASDFFAPEIAGIRMASDESVTNLIVPPSGVVSLRSVNQNSVLETNGFDLGTVNHPILHSSLHLDPQQNQYTRPNIVTPFAHSFNVKSGLGSSWDHVPSTVHCFRREDYMSATNISEQPSSLSKKVQSSMQGANLSIPGSATSYMFYGCGLCSACFNDSDHLLSHVKLNHFTRPKPYNCRVCSFSFASETLLLAHQNTHSSDSVKLNRCPCCPTATFGNRSALTRHILACHPLPNADPFRCTHCDKTFRKLRSLNSHIADVMDLLRHDHNLLESTSSEKHHTKKRIFPVDPAMLNDILQHSRLSANGDMTLSERFLLQAVKRASSAKCLVQRNSSRQKCSVCNLFFSSASDLRRHRKTHSELYHFNCTQCNRRFSRNYLLQQHVSSAHPTIADTQSSSRPPCGVRFLCHICKRRFGSKTSLRVHMHRHVCRQLNLCSSQLVVGQTSLTYAVSTVPTGEPVDVHRQNSLSASGIHMPDTLTQENHPRSYLHELVEQKADAWVASEAAPGMPTGVLCDMHCLPVTDVFPVTNTSEPADTTAAFPVVSAGRCANSSGQINLNCLPGDTLQAPVDSLQNCTDSVGTFITPKTHAKRGHKSHRKRSESEYTKSFQRLHRCTMCMKTFTRLYSLRRHEYTHTNYRPFACSFCGATFVQSSSLTTHILIHTGQRPHPCPTCNREFRQRTHLLRHLRAFHSDEIG